ncbi:MAG: hypothetical protein FJ318_03855 [SAR202 cluster bacterium]|nr:hypothetical protein [SAR202 cluster bacterium]
MSSNGTYVMPEAAIAELESVVAKIEARPGEFVSMAECREAQERLRTKDVVASLPEGLTEEDLVGILKLAMLTECATESYAAVFDRGGKQHDAAWLTHFNRRVWVPDELTHFLPFKGMLLDLGFSDAELEREMRQTREARYDHCCGITPVELTTYGMLQEFLTDNWHGLIANLLRQASPEGARLATNVKKRETLHYIWYRELTAVQVAANPELVPSVAGTVLSFEMPGAVLAPQYQKRALVWMPHMGVDFKRIAREFVRHFYDILGSTRRSGEFLLEIAARRGYNIGPVSPRTLMTWMNRLGGAGYSVIGEAILERVNLPVPEGVRHFYNAPYRRVRGALRGFVAKKLDLRVITGETSPEAAPAGA